MNKFSALAFALLLAACAPHADRLEEANNFKPYIVNQQETLPQATPPVSWAYPAGTRTQEIVRRWKLAGLVMGVYSKDVLNVVVGPQFYNLSPSSQRGLAHAVAQMYNVKHFMLVDTNTKRTIGTYTPTGLYLS